MADFLPSAEIHEKELVGRRAFGADKKIFSKEGEPTRYKIDVFLDDRLGTGLSVDRLGVGQVERKIVRALSPIGVAMGERMNKDFRGWAQFRVFSFRHVTFPTEAKGEVNRYHAEIMRDQYPTAAALRALAFELCVEASKHPFVPCAQQTTRTQG